MKKRFLLVIWVALASTLPTVGFGAAPEPAADPLASWGTFSQELLTTAKKQGWSVISMKDDWKRVFAFEK